MAITYPLALPSVLYFESLKPIKVKGFAAPTSPITQARQIVLQMGEHWRFEASLPEMSEVEARVWKAFFAQLDGPVGTFELPHPLYTGPLNGSVVANGQVDGGGQSGFEVATKGWPVSQAPLFTAGHDFVQIGTRVHEITQTVNSNGLGEATLDIWPPIIAPPPDLDAVNPLTPKHLLRLEAPVNAWPSDPQNWLFDTLRAREDWEGSAP